MFDGDRHTQGFRIKSVAKLTGLSAHVIRKWEERYQLISPSRSENGYRLYSEDDIQLLLYVKSRLESGSSIGHLASLGVEALRKAMNEGIVAITGISESSERYAKDIIATARCLDRTKTEIIIKKWSIYWELIGLLSRSFSLHFVRLVIFGIVGKSA